jgi:hypothetical protein
MHGQNHIKDFEIPFSFIYEAELLELDDEP